ncbi:MAG TPA: hypothetical protein VLC46_08365 [Thermoanaerobaculia bacterium]|jgi:hypothetical protein|nr:hypothetical protein [Thermoanaerobaculia bacterium]
MSTLANLLSDVLAHPNSVLLQKSEAAEELLETPLSTCNAIGTLLREGWTSDAHSKDVAEALVMILGRIAVREPAAIERLRAEPALAHWRDLISWGMTLARTGLGSVSHLHNMEREAIEFHDSVLARVDRDGHQVRLLFGPAYVHRSSGEPALDSGTGWLADTELTIDTSLGCNLRSKLPCGICDGYLRVGDHEFENVVPLPFESRSEVLLTIELTSGEVVKVSGKRVLIRVIGAYQFVEDFSP